METAELAGSVVAVVRINENPISTTTPLYRTPALSSPAPTTSIQSPLAPSTRTFPITMSFPQTASTGGPSTSPLPPTSASAAANTLGSLSSSLTSFNPLCLFTCCCDEPERRIEDSTGLPLTKPDFLLKEDVWEWERAARAPLSTELRHQDEDGSLIDYDRFVLKYGPRAPVKWVHLRVGTVRGQCASCAPATANHQELGWLYGLLLGIMGYFFLKMLWKGILFVGGGCGAGRSRSAGGARSAGAGGPSEAGEATRGRGFSYVSSVWDSVAGSVAMEGAGAKKRRRFISDASVPMSELTELTRRASGESGSSY